MTKKNWSKNPIKQLQGLAAIEQQPQMATTGPATSKARDPPSPPSKALVKQNSQLAVGGMIRAPRKKNTPPNLEQYVTNLKQRESQNCVAAVDYEDSPEEVCIVVKVHSYTLNPQTAVKKLISTMNIEPKIEPRDSQQQYKVQVSPPSFEILVANMNEFGKQWGITIKGGGVDNQGTNVGQQFNIELYTETGLLALVSMNCYSTNTSIHLQLNKGTKEAGR